jgi:hypothetical protein
VIIDSVDDLAAVFRGDRLPALLHTMQQEVKAMSAEEGWIAEPQRPVEWQDSHYSRMADRIERAAQQQTDLPAAD